MKKQLQHLFLIGLFVFLLSATLAAEKITVPLTNPNAPCTLKASLHYGGITIKGYNGKEVIINSEVMTRKYDDDEDERDDEDRSFRAKSKGLKRLPNLSMNLTVEEEDNIIRVRSSYSQRAVNLVIQVPFRTSLYLSCHHNGNIVVDKVSGEIEAKNHHGSIKLTNISGTVVSHTHHGYITVTFSQIASGKAMSFSTYHGDIDVSVPATTKANLKMKSGRGEIYTDFHVQMMQKAPVADRGKRSKGKFYIKIDKSVQGSINGGGAGLFFKTYHGNIYIRKGK